MSIRELIDPSNSVLIFIDHQPQMSFGVANIDRQLLKNNTVALAKAGKIFDVPVIYTSLSKQKALADTSGQNCWRFTRRLNRLNVPL